MNDIQIVENFFPTIIFKEIISKVSHSSARWSYKFRNPTHSDDYNCEVFKAQKNDPKIIEDISYFQYKFYGAEPQLRDERMAEVFKSHIQKNFNFEVDEITRINCNIIAPYIDFKDDQYTMPHVDVNIPHRSLVFYLHDCDGDTVLFDKIYEDGNEDLTELRTIKRVTPKKNSCVTFNGLRFHSASPSKTQLRKIINVNYTVK